MPKSFRQFVETEGAGSVTTSVASNISHARDKKKKEEGKPKPKPVSEQDENRAG